MRIDFMSISSPIIIEVDFDEKKIEHLETSLSDEEEKYLIDYPTVYIVNDNKKIAYPSSTRNTYSVYVGETTDIRRRTIEHIKNDSSYRDDWEEISNSSTSKMFIIGHEYFNKSLTLDIENKMMQYLSSVDAVKKINNRRTNPQNQYYTSEKFELIFSKIWRNLRKRNPEMFPLERIIKDSALFKASPFTKLTEEQLNAKSLIISKIEEAINRKKDNQLILVQGEAGSGKTVLLSSLFYELNQLSKNSVTDNENDDSYNPLLRGKSCYLLVNHDQQLKVYKEIASKLGILTKKDQQVVSKPTQFINSHDENDNRADIVIIDEAHLLWTQGKQSY